VCSFPLRLIGIVVCLAWNTPLKHVTHHHHAKHALILFHYLIVQARLEPHVLFPEANGTFTHGLTVWCLWDLNPRSSFSIHDFVTCSCHICIMYMLSHLCNSYHHMIFVFFSTWHEFLSYHKAHKNITQSTFSYPYLKPINHHQSISQHI
jgi:hypothetical protein